MYEIQIDAPRRRIIVTVTGPFALDEAAQFDTAVKAAAERAKAGGASFDMLVDLTQSALMTQAVSIESKTLLAWCIDNGMRRAANLTTTALATLQVRRVWASNRSRIFSSRQEAIAWLDERE